VAIFFARQWDLSKMSEFENFLEAWCVEYLSQFESAFDEIKHFHAHGAERLRDDAHKAGFGNEITLLGRVSEAAWSATSSVPMKDWSFEDGRCGDSAVAQLRIQLQQALRDRCWAADSLRR
jgi:hypothetical protein